MKKLFAVSLAVVMVLTMAGTALAGPGNGAPSGEHFNLNIIGVQNDKDAEKAGGHVIFVPLDTSDRTSRTGLEGAVDILLAPAPVGEGFAVLDGNATDGEGKFQMPSDVATTYTVWARGLGKPTGSAEMALWAWDPVNEVWLRSLGVVTISGHSVNGQPRQKFVDVSRDLFFLEDGTAVFSDVYEDYLWTYANNGQKLLQLRFYPVAD